MKPFGGVYEGRRVLLTGHTGFKGSWLAAWLEELGARVTGLALAPESAPAHWDLLRLGVDDHRVDVRDAAAVLAVINAASPEIVFHLAAQSLVRRSYRQPLDTWSTNVMGAANILEACRLHESVRAVVLITTDKCYENREWEWSYRETDALGGHDPYSASKASVELLADSYRQAFFEPAGRPLLATARAGNVIGGGDWSEDRLIPDLIRAVSADSALEVRSPNAKRPWQHVLDSLSGYLVLGQLLLGGQRECAVAWNFGPNSASNRTVAELLKALESTWPNLRWHQSARQQPHESGLLNLDSARAQRRLGWRPVWELEQALRATAAWYRAYLEHGSVRTHEQLAGYVSDAARAGLAWAR